MSKKYIVRAPDRKASGHPGQYRGGRFFPGGEDKTIEVIDQDECPKLEEKTGNKSRFYLDPDRVGKKAWALISGDPTLSVRPFGQMIIADDEKDAIKSIVEQLGYEIQEKNANLAELTAKVAELETVLASAREEADYASSLLKEKEELTAKVAELTATLESLTAPATKTEEPKQPKSKAVK